MSLEVGPHLLGCLPSPPDSRDFKLAPFLEAAQSGDPLDLALAALVQQPGAAKTTKLWAQIATSRLKSVAPFPDPPPEPDYLVWDNPHVTLNQGGTGHCVGFGWTQWANANPTNDDFDDAVGHAVYYECKVIDGKPGDEGGSWVRSGATAMRNRGRLDVYAFADNVAEIKGWIHAHGPVVLGTDWYDGMFSVDGDGFVHPTGDVAGGHCYLLAGDRPDEDAAIFLNSWGAGWGQGGWFKMKWDDVRMLVEDSWGEACATIELPLSGALGGWKWED